MADARRLKELGLVPAIADEVASQITAKQGSAVALANVGMDTEQAKGLAAQMANEANARALGELGFAMPLAKEIAAQITAENAE
jgi:hypothetical protein